MWYTQVLGRLYLPMENNLSFSLKHSKWKTQFNSGVNISFHKPFVLFKSIFPFCTMSRFSPSLAQPISIRVQKKSIQFNKKIITQTKPVLGCSVSNYCLNLGCAFNSREPVKSSWRCFVQAYLFITTVCFISLPQSRRGQKELTGDANEGGNYWLVCLLLLLAGCSDATRMPLSRLAH